MKLTDEVLRQISTDTGWSFYTVREIVSAIPERPAPAPEHHSALGAMVDEARIPQPAPQQDDAAAWVRVEDGLPEKAYGHNWLVWVKCGNKEGGYVTLAAYGDYVYEDEFADHNDPNYMKDNDPRCDEGNMCGSGWYREEETHGGQYDSIMVDLNGDVTHYMPKPKRPTGA